MVVVNQGDFLLDTPYGSYLSDRKQYVSDKRTTRRVCLNVETGVTQGSLFGSFLFLLQICESNLGESDFKLPIFADDTTTNNADRAGCSSPQQENDRLSEWFCAN